MCCARAIELLLVGGDAGTRWDRRSATLASARISPFSGSITTTAPPSASCAATASASSRSAMNCRSRSMVVSTVAPGTGARSGRVSRREWPRSGDLITSCRPGRPARMRVHRQLDAGLALVVDVGVADEVRRGARRRDRSAAAPRRCARSARSSAAAAPPPRRPAACGAGTRSARRGPDQRSCLASAWRVGGVAVVRARGTARAAVRLGIGDQRAASPRARSRASTSRAGCRRGRRSRRAAPGWPAATAAAPRRARAARRAGRRAGRPGAPRRRRPRRRRSPASTLSRRAKVARQSVIGAPRRAGGRRRAAICGSAWAATCSPPEASDGADDDPRRRAIGADHVRAQRQLLDAARRRQALDVEAQPPLQLAGLAQLALGALDLGARRASR